jgi:hypothetical protein
MTSEHLSTDPVTFEHVLPVPAVRAFTTYVERIGEWWPAGFRALGSQRPGSVVIEPHVGGRVYETGPDGVEHDWGQVTEYDAAGSSLAHTFHLAQDAEHPTEVAVTFADRDASEGTVMMFEHRGWTEHNAGLRPKFASDGGWVVVLGGYLALFA